ncbi:MAG: rhamnan synthesis F family protein [Pseudomonadota bacterium]
MARSVPEPAADTSDAKDPVADANDLALSAQQQDWWDGRAVALPEGGERKSAIGAYVKLLESEFATAPKLAIWDPRVSLLSSLWIEAALETGARVSFALLLSDPGASASLVMDRFGLSADAAVALWLRYTLDAELHSRGYARSILQTDAFAKDPISTLAQAHTVLGLPRSEPTGDVRAHVQRLAASTVPATSGEIQTHLLTLANEVHEVLAQGADLPGTAETLDRLRGDFDVALSRPVSDKSGKEALVLEKNQNDYGVPIDRSSAVKGAQPDEGTDEFDSVLTQLDEANETVVALLAEARGLSDKLERATAELASATGDLARARRRPVKTLRDYLKFKALTGMSKASPLLPARMAERFARSAAKRDPDRSLRLDGQKLGPGRKRAARQNSATGSTTHHDGRRKPDPNQKDILVVSHDAGRTGAPILALNLVQVLSRRYNVTTLCLHGGELVTNFRDHSIAVWEVGKRSDEISFHVSILNDVTAAHSFDFAIVNSVESRHILPALKARGVPNVVLLHEFASYTLPKFAYPMAISAADQSVFSTGLTLDNAVETHNLTRTPTMHVLPQGKCEVPTAAKLPAEAKIERHRLTELFRPNGQSSRRFIVLGAGSVHIRKGVDLFIDTAMRVLNRPDGKNAIFVWVGAGYDPDTDYAYSVYLQDQLRRAGLTERVLVLSETAEIETVYSLADALILTSRLDPLPNVAIDAMSAGLPVLCFDRTTGIAETLSNAGLKDDCVARYLDTVDLADKLLALAASPETQAEISTKVRNFAEIAFDFPAYVERIERLALAAMDFPSLLEKDLETIEAAGRFRPDFCVDNRAPNKPLADGIRDYLTRIRTGVLPRKPEPGFHPYVFAENWAGALQEGADPYAEFLRQGRPDGPWIVPVIEGFPAPDEAGTPAQMRAALHIHAFFSDQLADIVERLEQNVMRPDLFVSVANGAGARAARKALSGYSGVVASVEVVPNAGRDIGPFLTSFGEVLVCDYDVVGHVHTKKSAHLKDADTIGNWVEFAYSCIIGRKRTGAMMDQILQKMADDPTIGIVYPDDPNILGWTNNRRQADRIAESMGVGPLPEAFNFPIGTMFWMRSEALRPFVDLGLTWADYPCEPVPSDGTMLHALERLFGIVPQLQSWQTVVTNIPNTTR